MVHFVATARKGPIPVKEQDKDSNSKLWDLQVYLHKLWLEKMANDKLYDDATIPHGWRCNCCTHTLFLSEVHRKK